MYSILLLGNPNSGKSSLLNQLCNLSQKTGNYAGVTTDKYSGTYQHSKNTFRIIDTPGTYGLYTFSNDESIIHDILFSRDSTISKIDLILFVLEEQNIKRSLYLLSQTMELNLPIMIVSTMKDLHNTHKEQVNFSSLSEILNIPVIQTSVKDEDSINKLKEDIYQHLLTETTIKYKANNIEKSDVLIPWQQKLENISPIPNLSSFEINSLLFFQDGLLTKKLKKKYPNFTIPLDNLQKDFQEQYKYHNTINIYTFTKKRYQWINTILQKVVHLQNKHIPPPRWKIILEFITTHKLLAPWVFIFVVFLIFKSVYSWSAPFISLIEAFLGILDQTVSQYTFLPTILLSFIKDGVIAGVGSILVFLPQITLLFFFVSLIEETGYLARLTFIADRSVSWSGLNGRSFIPLLSSFACAVPSITQTRIIEEENVRVSTILLSPFMSCSARLPVYLLFISTFIQPVWGEIGATGILFLMHLVGPILGLPFIFLINKKFFNQKQNVEFIQEITPYKLPIWKNIFFRTFFAAKNFLYQAGGVIFVFSIIIWALTYFPQSQNLTNKIQNKYTSIQINTQQSIIMQNDKKQQKLNELKYQQKLDELTYQEKIELKSAHLENSILGRSGKFIQPIFSPLGFDWKITVGVLAAFPARELIISTLGILYNIPEEVNEKSKTLQEKLLSSYEKNTPLTNTPLVALSIMFFFAICCQCSSTLAVMYRELGSIKWPILTFLYMTLSAYFISLLVYQVGIFFT